MNYRHAYHAGNFADVLKHLALVELLRLLTAKDKKLFVLDTHAGVGGYDLAAGLAARTREADSGIMRLMAMPRAGMPEAVARYLAAVAAYDRKFGRGDGLRHYPGSPRLARAGLRPGDRFIACELHPQDALALKREFAGDRAVEVRQADGYHALKALLPPVERRGLVLVDPPFEVTDEFDRLARALKHALRRFATGCYAVWYPIKDEAAVEAFRATLAGLKALILELRLDAVPDGKLAACGLAVINPPWTFQETMAGALPWLGSALDARTAMAPIPEQTG
ncbi:MAG TPA: 23S rRNA (adenine(2030)-N(6))-methyltransferase RlmJ [Reyranella sp.]|nr:23S rRNA (adenine(2030)-N(6))-methyltransferase RlmJ [Reyranella sp.]